MKMLRHLTLTLLALLTLPAAHAAPTPGNTNGTLWAWGLNGNGQLGDGTTVNSTSPAQIRTATSWQSVAAGDDHTVAVQAALSAFEINVTGNHVSIADGDRKFAARADTPEQDWPIEGGLTSLTLPGLPMPSRGELFFIDAGVANPCAFWLTVPKGGTVVCIPAGVDSWRFMAQEAARFRGLSAIHIVSHGQPGAVVLNGQHYAAADLETLTVTLQQLGRALTKNGDIFLYGCEVGAGVAGQNLLNTLAAVTGADIAASKDNTGNAAQGGNWDLEITTGQIDPSLALNATSMAGYDAVLAQVTVTTTADSGAGSLRQAITDTNSTSANDEIVFAASLFTNGPSTITLGSAALPTIAATHSAGSLVITGPGASSLIISGDNGNSNRDFSIFNIASGGNLSISGVTVSGAKTTGNGAGFSNRGTLAVTNSLISGNSGVYTGGGIYSTGMLSVSGSTFTGNSAEYGGGLSIWGYSTGTVSNSTFSGNTAFGQGGGLFNNGTLTIRNTTVSGNTATQAAEAGGLHNNATLYIANTLIANSTNGGDFAGSGTVNVTSPATASNNLVTQSDLAWATTVTSAQLNLGPLQNNGGTTSTMALGAGSVAIGAGNSPVSNATPINGVDQRGVTRSSTAPSIGAFEVVLLNTANTPTFGTPTATADGFTAQISNYDANFTYGGTATEGGTVAISGTGFVTVSGVGPNTSSTATLTTTRTNYVSGSAQVTAVSLNAANTPTFGTPTATADGFTVQISNYDASYTYGGTATAGGTVAISGSGLITVSGVGPNTSSTATLTTTRTNYVSGSAQVTAAAKTAPTLAAIAVTGREDTTLTFTAANFTGAYSHAESAALASITVAALPATGTLKLSGTNVTASQVIPVADLGNLTYVPSANENGAKTFTVTASDGTLSSAAATVKMTLTAVNEACTLTAWGANYTGQLGDGTTTDRTSPVQIGSATSWQSVAAGYVYTVAVRTDGTLWAWGANFYRQLGDGTTTDRNSPVQIGSATSWQSVAAGNQHALAVRTDGTLWAWGYNGNGQLGDGTTTDRASPVQIGSATTWQSVAAGGSHTVAVRTDGTLWAWGRNDFGQVGDGTNPPRTSPVQIGTATSWQSVAAGYYHTVAVRTDGTLWAWGYNWAGQLGDGTNTDRTSPIQIGTATSWQSVAAGESHTLAVRTDGTLWAWGSNIYGKLGDGTITTRTSPIQIGTATSWQSVAAGGSHTVAVRTDGTLWAWGRNEFGQLGDVTTTDRTSPVQIGSATSWQSVAAGSFHTVAVQAALPAPEITVTVNSLSILDGDSTPSTTDHTDFGNALVTGGTVVRTFTIANNGTVSLNLSGTLLVAVSGTHAADFTVTALPASPVTASGSTTFQVTFTPSGSGTRSATLTLANDDSDEGTFDFVIQGTGVSPFTTWQTLNGSTGTTAADHDNDGVSDGIEYFVGGPNGNTTGQTTLPSIINNSGSLSITWIKGTGYPGVYGSDYLIETTATLTDTWTPETLGVNVTLIGNNVIYTFPAASGDRRFVRLKVMAPSLGGGIGGGGGGGGR